MFVFTNAGITREQLLKVTWNISDRLAHLVEEKWRLEEATPEESSDRLKAIAQEQDDLRALRNELEKHLDIWGSV